MIKEAPSQWTDNTCQLFTLSFGLKHSFPQLLPLSRKSHSTKAIKQKLTKVSNCKYNSFNSEIIMLLHTCVQISSIFGCWFSLSKQNLNRMGLSYVAVHMPMQMWLMWGFLCVCLTFIAWCTHVHTSSTDTWRKDSSVSPGGVKSAWHTLPHLLSSSLCSKCFTDRPWDR